MATVTRAGLSDAVHRESGLSHRDARELVDDMIETICARLEAGEPVMISGFGTFTVRDKGERVGRNPRTGEETPIPARRVVVGCSGGEGAGGSATVDDGWPGSSLEGGGQAPDCRRELSAWDFGRAGGTLQHGQRELGV